MGESLNSGSGTNPLALNSDLTANIKCFKIMVTLWILGRGTCFPGFPDYWPAPGARPHLHVPKETRSGKVSVGVCLKSTLRVTPLNAVELKV